jgi:hypothetical protein
MIRTVSRFLLLRESWASPCNGLHLKLIVAELVNNFTAFYETRRFSAVQESTTEPYPDVKSNPQPMAPSQIHIRATRVFKICRLNLQYCPARWFPNSLFRVSRAQFTVVAAGRIENMNASISKNWFSLWEFIFLFLIIKKHEENFPDFREAKRLSPNTWILFLSCEDPGATTPVNSPYIRPLGQTLPRLSKVDDPSL